MFSLAQSLDFSGSMPQLVGQVLISSTNVKPLPSLLYLIAFVTAFFALRISAGLSRDTRSI